MTFTLTFVASMVGCGRFADYAPADLRDAAVVEHLEFHVRPETLHTWLFLFPEEDCSREESPGSWVADGHCESETGEHWDGRAVREIADDHTVTTYTDFRFSGRHDCGEYIVDIHSGSSTEWEDGRFEIDVSGGTGNAACADGDGMPGWSYLFDVAYEGGAPLDGEPEIWSGSGRYADTEVGVVEASTASIESGSCFDEPESGTIRLSADGREGTLEYDGAVACDGLATWTLDGDPPTQVQVRACAAVTNTAWPLWIAALMASRRRPASAGGPTAEARAARRPARGTARSPR